jgi:hypothetical protein
MYILQLNNIRDQFNKQITSDKKIFFMKIEDGLRVFDTDRTPSLKKRSVRPFDWSDYISSKTMVIIESKEMPI